MLIASGLMLALGATTALPQAIYHLKMNDINGQYVSLEAYRGKVLLVVNVASQCGYTKQYAGLEALYRRHREQGLVVLGFPCNQFGGQEPGSSEEIKQFCSSRFGVTFPLFEKIEVNGANRTALYQTLAGKDSSFPGNIKWNFTKFLVGRNGALLRRFEPQTAPDSADLTQAVEAALAAKP